jgi:4-amino-4-deoxy-L-arabinose transferase-like glycosyltransferase
MKVAARMLLRTLVGQRRDILIVIGLFALSRALYAWLGVRFDFSPFPWYMQFIDAPLLKERLLESLWYYHANPPMLNLVVGAGLKLFGEHVGTFCAVLFHLLGVLLALAVFALTSRLSGSRLAAHIAAGLLVFSPAFVLYENWVMYTFPAVALLTVAAAALYRYLQTSQTRWCVTFFALLALLLLTRSLFHLAWMVVVAALLAAIMHGQRRQVLLAAIFPVLIVAGWYGKNYYLFGMFSSSSWMGLGLSNISTLVATREELQPLVADGRLTPYALVSRYRETQKLFVPPAPPTGIPVLDQIVKTDRHLNYNNSRIIEMNRYYTHDAVTVARTFPFSYVVGLIISNRLFFSPTDMNLYFTADNRAAALPMEKLFNPLLYGAGTQSHMLAQPHFGFDHNMRLEVNTSVPFIVLWWVVLAYGYVQARRGLLSDSPDSRPRAVVIGFIVFTAVYVYVVGTAFELAENYRYRYLVEPLLLVLTVTAVTSLIEAVRRRISSRVATEG